ncbi:MAG: hypothetical protein U0411_11555 [Thermodesulfovibrionales bacterium]
MNVAYYVDYSKNKNSFFINLSYFTALTLSDNYHGEKVSSCRTVFGTEKEGGQSLSFCMGMPMRSAFLGQMFHHKQRFRRRT